MQPTPIRFDDGAAYEDFMGKWSRLAGETFLQWLAPPPGRRWVDVGCGNGAFTELLVERCAPVEVHGIDPSPEQIAYARGRLAEAPVELCTGDAMALPYADAGFDAAVMALVIFFVPDPARGVAEMARVVEPGGSVSAYAWDILGGGFPFAALQEEAAALGAAPAWPPSVEASRLDAMRALWTDAGLLDVETTTIDVERRFDDFDAFWRIARTGPRLAPAVAALPADAVARLQARLRARLVTDAGGAHHLQRPGQRGQGAGGVTTARAEAAIGNGPDAITPCDRQPERLLQGRRFGRSISPVIITVEAPHGHRSSVSIWPQPSRRLPKQYRFAGTEAVVKHFGNGVLLLPVDDPWQTLEAGLALFEPGFVIEREQPPAEVRADIDAAALASPPEAPALAKARPRR